MKREEINKKVESDIKEEKDVRFDSKILSSSHLNFLFGSGVNGKAFPQLAGFEKTIKELEKELRVKKIDNFEKSIDLIKKDERKEEILNIFSDEFKEFHKNIDWNHPSIANIVNLLWEINKLVSESENRTVAMKQINVYTFNYDKIIEKSLEKFGSLYNVISASNLDNHSKFFNLVGYNYELEKHVPTFIISKIHGEIDNPIFPGRNKYESVLTNKFFEVIFKMKSQLSRMNSLLFVIGYSGGDDHINGILKDCILGGLTIYWFKFVETDNIPTDIKDKVIIIENKNKMDTTERCLEMVRSIWGEQ